jgi:YD repeat-containing protein
MSKVTYAYDEGDFTSDTNLEQNISNVIYHDNTNYSSSFVIGRGNLTSTKRWNVEYPTSSSYAVTSSVKYNIAGAPVAQISPWDGTNTRQVKISYADNFNDTSTTRYTYAYPTKLYDPEENYSEVRYRFDIGTNVWAKSPDLNSSVQGKVSARIYDSAGRLQRESVFKGNQAYSNNQEHAYARYEYPTNNVQSKVYSTLVDNDSDGADGDDEVLSESWADGAGRILKSRTPFAYTNGSPTVWSGALVEYDILGRIKRSSVPTEVDSSWTPTGTDSTRGWLWTHKKYDWKGRVTRIINTDGADSSTLNDSDQLFSYEGCGCAGGEVVTVEGESVPVPGQSYSARRKQKIYSDILGRQNKTEIYEWNGTSVYTTTVNTFNGRDQITNTRQYAGTTSSTSYRDVSMTYDGHSRMKTRHFPIEDALAETSWIYNADDSVQQAIDPRGVITNFTYNSRGAVTNIDYQLPDPNPADIPDTHDVTYFYDNAGNRIEMRDGLGPVNSPGVTYEYNELSQLTAETRHFADTLQNAPQNGYRMEYTYNSSGGLKSVADPFGSEVVYTHDKTGRLTKVDGDAFGDNTAGHYADNIKYRAFGQVKQMNYKTTDNALVSLSYDNRLRVLQYQVASSEATGGYLKKAQFAYLADSRPQTMDDQVNGDFDRTYQYDFAGRLTANQFGNPQASNYPYAQTIQYDRFSQMTARATTHWQATNNITVAFTSDGRRQAVSYQVPVYDAAGNLLDSGAAANTGNYQHSEYDAANRQTTGATRYREKMGLYVYWTYENETT